RTGIARARPRKQRGAHTSQPRPADGGADCRRGLQLDAPTGVVVPRPAGRNGLRCAPAGRARRCRAEHLYAVPAADPATLRTDGVAGPVALGPTPGSGLRVLRAPSARKEAI